MPNYLCHACICGYSSCDFDNIKIGCVAAEECLCIQSAGCCAIGADPYKIAFCDNKDKECLSCELLLCRYALKQPEVLCASAGQCLCIKEACAFPFDDDYVKEPTCAVCCVACVPEAGIMKEAPKSPAIDRFN